MPVHTSEWHSGRAGKFSGNTPSPGYPLDGYLNREGCHRLQIRSHRLVVQEDRIEVDFAEGDTVVVTGGVWKDTIGVIQAMNPGKQSVTINVELFGRETPVEISFADVKLAN